MFGRKYLQPSSPPSSRARLYPSLESRPTITAAGSASASPTFCSPVFMYEYVSSSACLLSRPNRRHRLRNSPADNAAQLFLLEIDILLAREPAHRRGGRQPEREPRAPLATPHVPKLRVGWDHHVDDFQNRARPARSSCPALGRCPRATGEQITSSLLRSLLPMEPKSMYLLLTQPLGK